MTDALNSARAQIAARFATLAPAQRAAFLDSLQEKGVAFASLPIVPAARTAALPLSYAQQRLWFLQQLEPGSSAYHMPGALRLDGPLDIDALRRAFDTIAARHEVLRTTIAIDEDGKPWQTIHQTLPPAFTVSVPPDNAAGSIDDWVGQEVARLCGEPFDLAQGPLWRVALVRLAEQAHVMVVVLHHIVADGASIPLIVRELAEAYAGHDPRPAPVIQYADYAVWQRNWMEAGEAQRQTAYWRQRLGDEQATQAALDLPLDRPRQARPDLCGAEQAFELPAAVVTRLRELALGHGATLNMVMLAAYAVLLYRYTGQPDIRIGVPVANRQRSETEPLIGCFVNTQVTRIELMPRESFAALLDRVRDQAAADHERQALPFDLLVEALQPERSLSQAPLFSVTFDHRVDGASAQVALAGLHVTPFEIPVTSAKFELSLATSEMPDGNAIVRIAYATAVFDAATIARMGRHYCRLLSVVAKSPDTTAAHVSLLDDDERAQLTAWSLSGYQTPPFEPVHLSVARHARQSPDAVAVVFGDSHVTYGELNREANQLAHRLLGLGIGAEARVGVALSRSPRMIATLLAVLKAGAAFVPLDASYPAQRLRDMQADARLNLLLTERALRDGLPVMVDVPVLCVDDDADSYASGDPEVTIHAEQLAYVIYTSGSTGKPKGVGVAHGPLAMHCVSTAECYDITPASRELHFLSFSFDGAHERWMVPLTSGASIVLRDDALWSVEQTYTALQRHAVTHAGFPPKYLHQLAAWGEQAGNPPPLWLYSFGGEAMPRAGVANLVAALRPQHVINGYGPTETVVTPLVWKAPAATAEAQIAGAYAPIGRPVGERSAHVLDDNLEPVPVGVPGELHLGGAGVARGYLGQPGLTADRFIPDPFGAPGARLYRTGDLVRWRADGCIEYLGRRDHQVKIRGYRIELGEIEAHLLALPGVRQAAVLPHDTPSGQRLVAYVGADDALDIDRVRAAVADALPDYMVPSAFVCVERLPVTPNGKLDRRALPAPQWSANTAYVAAETAAQRVLAAVWQDVLGIAQVGLHDNFFTLGGDSILSLQIVARARQRGWRLTPRQVFEHQTVAALAAVAVEIVEDAGDDAPADEDTPFGLTPIQATFFAQPMPDRNRFNQSVLLRSSTAVNVEALSTALADLLVQHPVLRYRFAQTPQGWRQHAHAHGEVPLTCGTADDAAAVTAACDAAQGELDIVNGPLMRAVHLRVADGSERLFLVCHHLVIDGVSWRIVLEDLQRAYAARAAGGAPQWPPAAARYGSWQRILARQGVAACAAEADHWRTATALETRLPADFDIGDAEAVQSTQQVATLALDTATTARLLKSAHGVYRTTVNDLLLAGFSRALSAFAGAREICMHLEGHGREADAIGSTLDVSRTVGWFTSVAPVRLCADADPGNHIVGVKEALRTMPRHGIGYGVLRHGGADIALPDCQPRILFNYLGQFDGATTEGPWQMAAEDTGSGIDARTPLPAWLVFNGSVQAGCLRFRCQYSGARYRATTIAALMDAIGAALREVVDHCEGRSSGRLTPSDVPASALTQAQLDTLAFEADDIDDIWRPTPMQRGMILHGRRHPLSPAYAVQVVATMDGLDAERMVNAWQAAVTRYPMLRARVAWVETGARPEPLLVAPRTATLPVHRLDWRDEPGREVPVSAPDDARWQVLCDAEFRAGFAMQQAPLMRLTLARVGDDTWRFAWTWHHLMMDGWSMSRLLGEVLRGYDGEVPGDAAVPPRTHAGWLLRQADANRDAEAMWRARLAPFATAPTRLTRTTAAVARGQVMKAVERVVEAPALRALAGFANRAQVTLNTLVQAAWALTLRRLTGHDTLAFGVVGSGRSADLPEIERVIGLLVSTLPLIQTVDAGQLVADWLRALQADNLALREFEHAPPAWLQSWAIDDNAAPFDSMLIFENYPVDSTLRETERGRLRFSDVDNRGQMSYPVTVIVIPRETLTVRVEYDTAALDDATAAAAAGYCMQVLDALPAADELQVGTLAARAAAADGPYLTRAA
nr:non-ribosomal peptide synthetase [uncultured Cupriavidus sp.]